MQSRIEMNDFSQSATFTCSWANCGRAFGKREHLRRHERSHARDSQHECPTCGKQFVRRDVMTRHAALHKDANRKSRKVSCLECIRLKVRCDGQPGETCRRCRKAARACRYRSQVDGPILDQAVNLASSGLPSPANLTDDMPNLDSDFVSSVQPGLQPTSASHSLQSSLAFAGALPNPSGFPFDTLYRFNTDPNESFFGWDAIEVDSDDMGYIGLPSLDFFRDGSDFTRDSTQEHPFGADSRRLTSSNTIGDGQPPDTPWPHVYRPNEKDSQIDLAPAEVKSPSIIQQPDSGYVKEETREAIISLLNGHQSNRPVVDEASFPSAQVLSTCINLYFRHFHETLPIVRRFKPQDTYASPILLLAMAAIGAMYSRDKLRGLAVALNKLVRRAILTMQESDSSTVFDVSFVQAALLQSIFGLFCGSRMLYQHAEISRATLVTAARRMHLLRPGLSFVHELQRRTGAPTQEELDKAEADDNERRVLGWAIYLYDMQISALLSIPSTFGIPEINMSLPEDEENRCQMNVDESSQGFCDALNELIATGSLSRPLSSFGLSIIAYTLYRLCSDVAATETICSTSSPSPDFRYRLAFPANFKHNPQELLDQLAASCNVSRTAPNSLMTSVEILSRLGHIQFTWPGFLNNIKVAAGKSGTEESKFAAREWIKDRIAVDPIGAKFILSEASQLGTILARHPFDTPPETVLIFDVALTFWALLKFSSHPSHLLLADPMSINTESGGNDTDGKADNTWSIHFEGLGDLAELTSSKALRIFRQRMDYLSWGLKEQFKQVLQNLEREETSR